MTQPYIEEREGWGQGPWEHEPDKAEWRAHGLPCLIVRGPGGAWCGYVGVPPGHPWHGLEYSHDDINVEVHGGLTYSNACKGQICHVARAGEPEHVWWLGFDCAHCMDIAPAMEARLRALTSERRTGEFGGSLSRSGLCDAGDGRPGRAGQGRVD